MDKKINIGFLYQDLMSTYGDSGNVEVLQKRLENQGFQTQIINLSTDTDIKQFRDVDFYFFGGGQDQNQEFVASDLEKGKGEVIKKKVADGCPLLSICGGYQLLGKWYQPYGASKLEGVGIFDIETRASDKRMISNLYIKVLSIFGEELIGFENHSGQTFLTDKAQPLGNVIKGFGNNGEDKTEGAVYKNAFGCYLHGPVLPKNPKFADYLIGKILEYKGMNVSLKHLNDEVEIKSHKQSVERAFNN